MLTLPPALKWGRGHLTLTPDYVAGKRIFVIGDVHGCYDQMMELLTKADVLTPDRKCVADDAVVIFVGDIINRGAENLKVS